MLTATCPVCESELEFGINECTPYCFKNYAPAGPRELKGFKIHCPCCHNELGANEIKGRMDV